MTRYVCVSCGFETDDDDMPEKPCPYCGEQMVEKINVIP